MNDPTQRPPAGPDPGGPGRALGHAPGTRPPGLGPHCVGQRVVVRRLLREERGPSGGPAFTDLLGVMETWQGGETRVRDASGAVTAIPLADIVSGKPVPPRPSPRLRVSPAAAERRAVAGWPPQVSTPLGEWLLRAAGGFSTRANSALAVGDPGVPVAAALERVVGFYRDLDLPPLAQVVVDSDEHGSLADAGWVTARPGEADTEFQIASVARARRAARGLSLRDVPRMRRSETADPGWLADDARAREHRPEARAVLEGPPEVVFVSAGDPVVAKGRAAMAGPADDWAGITDIWVSPTHRRQGLAVAVMTELLGWAAERGATTAYLQTRGDNAGALALYDALGFATHHAYRYLTPTEQASG